MWSYDSLGYTLLQTDSDSCPFLSSCWLKHVLNAQTYLLRNCTQLTDVHDFCMRLYTSGTSTVNRHDVFSLRRLLLSTHADRQGVYVSVTVFQFVCTVTNFSAEDKTRGFKFCSRQGITNFCELCSPESQNGTNRQAREPRPPACKHYRRDAQT